MNYQIAFILVGIWAITPFIVLTIGLWWERKYLTSQREDKA